MNKTVVTLLITSSLADSTIFANYNYLCSIYKLYRLEVFVSREKKFHIYLNKKVLYCNLLISGKLYEHLADIDTSACNMAEYLIKEMARKQGVTEELKGKDMMRWVGLMNNIRACADEIVLNDIVYS